MYYFNILMIGEKDVIFDHPAFCYLREAQMFCLFIIFSSFKQESLQNTKSLPLHFTSTFHLLLHFNINSAVENQVNIIASIVANPLSLIFGSYFQYSCM